MSSAGKPLIDYVCSVIRDLRIEREIRVVEMAELSQIALGFDIGESVVATCRAPK